MVKNTLKIVYKSVLVVVTVLGVLLCVCCMYMVIRRAQGEELPTVFGYTIATVSTGSMSPAIEAGDLIFIKSCDSYAEGEVITFYDADMGAYVTHRIIGEQDGGFITKGDYNNSEDTSIVYYENIVGKVVGVIGGAGTAISFLQTPVGIICLICIVLCMWFIYKIAQLLIKGYKEKKEE